jgi:malonyl-CoA decarboxylase
MNDLSNSAKGTTVRALWDWITGGRRTRVAAERRTLTASELRGVRATLREMVETVGGEASARRRVASLATLYMGLDDDGRRAFLLLLATEFGPDPTGITASVAAYVESSTPEERRRAESGLRAALASPRIRILKQFNLLHEGVKFLVDLRADVLRFVRQSPQLEALDAELFELLGGWFDIGNLELRRISWSSPAALLERLIAYEAVHEIRSWTDLRNRLDSDRRCYAFFHPRMPEEPLIFVEIALTRDMASNVHTLLDESAPQTDPHTAQAAIFYSISNTQPGLRGVSFGGFLIKRVVDELCGDFPKLKTFATLSPVPGFRKWLDAHLKARDATLFGVEEAKRLAVAGKAHDAFDGVANLLAQDLARCTDPDTVSAVLCRLIARYLIEEKEDDRPLDPVARFHLGNGARLERVNWLADVSTRGLKQSAGIMVNYLYEIADIEPNHEAFAREGRVVVSNGVKRLLRKPQ